MNAQFITTSLKSAVNAAYSKHGYNLRGLPFNQDWYAHLFANSWNLTDRILKNYPLKYIQEIAEDNRLDSVDSMLMSFKNQVFLKILHKIETTGEKLDKDDVDKVFNLVLDRLDKLNSQTIHEFQQELLNS